MDIESAVRLIAFYLPQFHPIKENDQWWGTGFTEWHNVVQGRPRFKGHYQPHLPADLGFYDLRLPEIRAAQAAMASQYGIHGFCYYHYWFNGRRILERPFNEVLHSNKPALPFCLCWANENWTRVWDGGENDILLAQHYSEEDDLAHINSLLPALFDDRYIRIAGKPVLLVYRTELLPSPARTAEIWRQAAHTAGLGDIYLIRVESFVENIDPASIGFDAAVEFAPDWRNMQSRRIDGRWDRLLAAFGLLPRFFLENDLESYGDMAARMLARPPSGFNRFPCVTPGFDNSARRKKGAAVFLDATPQKYQAWLHRTIARSRQEKQGDERIVFINAWNEWGEGNHLEPDLKWGRAYLEATRQALY